MSLPSGTAQAEGVKLRKTCRGCKQPLYGGSQDGHFPVAGIGIMHLECARQYCSLQGIELEEAVPICKHWRLKGHCIYQDECRNRHPPDAKGGSQPVAAQRSPSKKDRAAAWRAHNATMQGQQSALLDSQPCSLHAPQPAVDQLEISRRSQSHLAQALRPARGAPPQPSYAHSGNPSIVMQSPSVSGEDAAQSVAGEDPAQSIAGETQAQHSLQEPARFACAPARKRLSYARLGPAGFDGALETAGPECRAAQDSAGLRRFKIRNRFRAGAFRRFLIDTFGREALAGGSGILDIGGGRGELSFELLNLNNIRATVVDPRPGSLSKQAKWLKTGFFHRNAVYQAYVDRPLSAFAASEPEVPQSVRLVLSAELCANLAACDPASAADTDLSSLLEQAFYEALSDRWIHHGADHEEMGPSWAALGSQGSGQTSGPAASTSSEVPSAHGGGAAAAHPVNGLGSPQQSVESCPGYEASARDSMPAEAAGQSPAQTPMQGRIRAKLGLQSSPALTSKQQAQAYDSKTDVPHEPLSKAEGTSRGLGAGEVAEVRSLFQDASVLVGMHPDQATEHIVGLAQQLRKPFAVVPCCVHARDFPQRRLPCGGPVRSHDDLVAYIVSKDPLAIEVAELPFEGRNTVVFCRQWSHKA